MGAVHKAGDGAAGTAIETTGAAIAEAVRYGVVVAQLAAAAARLRGLSEQVRGAYRYVDGCARAVERLAEQMAGLEVDGDTVAEHQDAAAVMRGVLEEAEAMAAATEDLAVLFAQAAAGHEGDYGPVAEAVHAMPVPMADAQFYANR